MPAARVLDRDLHARVPPVERREGLLDGRGGPSGAAHHAQPQPPDQHAGQGGERVPGGGDVVEDGPRPGSSSSPAGARRTDRLVRSNSTTPCARGRVFTGYALTVALAYASLFGYLAASAVLGACMFAGGVLVTPLLALGGEGTALPMAAVVGGGALAALLATLLLTGVHRRGGIVTRSGGTSSA